LKTIWDSNKGDGLSLSQKVLDKVKPDVPLKSKIDVAQKKLEVQITKLDSIHGKLKQKHDFIFNKIVDAQKSHNNAYARAYAIELHEIRKMENMIGGAKLAMEQIKLRLNTVSELGDVVVTLSPCMSVIKGLSASIGGIMPEANSSMQDLTSILGDVLSGSSMGSADLMTPASYSSSDAQAILEEAHSVIVNQTRSNIPEVPTQLKQQARKEISFI
jgi:division protein CdvB (Snf7/Vps24/ESCRT-III family)